MADLTARRFPCHIIFACLFASFRHEGLEGHGRPVLGGLESGVATLGEDLLGEVCNFCSDPLIQTATSKITNFARRPDISFAPFIPDEHVESYLWAWLNGP